MVLPPLANPSGFLLRFLPPKNEGINLPQSSTYSSPEKLEWLANK